MAKLSDAEFTERTRASNRRRAERQRQRLVQSGKSAFTVWIPDRLRQALVARAANDGATIYDTVTALLAAALNQPADDRLARILALKQEHPDLSNYAIAAKIGCSESTVRRLLKQSAIASQ